MEVESAFGPANPLDRALPVAVPAGIADSAWPVLAGIAVVVAWLSVVKAFALGPMIRESVAVVVVVAVAAVIGVEVEALWMKNL